MVRARRTSYPQKFGEVKKMGKGGSFMNRVKLVFLAASMVLAMAFTFSCSSGDEESGIPIGGGDKGNNIANYKTKKIGTQTWMAENLNYYVDGSKCYDNDPANCAKYGRLYDWATAMALPASCNSNSCSGQIQTKHRGVCPSGWHIPSDDEWDALYDAAGGSSTAGKHLKAKDGWNDCGPSGSGKSYSCEDTHGFSALPGGRDSGGYFDDVGYFGRWWSASEYSSTSAYSRGMNYYYEYANGYNGGKDFLFSVRCVKD
jgi:uncharacterized protein (TIGR02145 family)